MYVIYVIIFLGNGSIWYQLTKLLFDRKTEFNHYIPSFCTVSSYKMYRLVYVDCMPITQVFFFLSEQQYIRIFIIQTLTY